jgi:HPt (histidine-containing phosphotransfer) domain-containing protein
MSIDDAALRNLQATVGNDPKDLVDLIESFLDEGPELLDALHEASLVSDRKKMLRSVHSLKSNARDFGAKDLRVMCEDFENQLRTDQTIPDVEQRIRAIRNEWPSINNTLREIVAAINGD